MITRGDRLPDPAILLDGRILDVPDRAGAIADSEPLRRGVEQRSKQGEIRMFYIVAVLALGNPSHTFSRIEIPTPLTETQCATTAQIYIDREERIRAMRQRGWRVIMWDCSKSIEL
jgi:hypothetical protein